MARFHGKGIGGGSDISRSMASITEETKPDEGAISTSPEIILWIASSSVMVFL
jgi:hypothetical protein